MTVDRSVVPVTVLTARWWTVLTSNCCPGPAAGPVAGLAQLAPPRAAGLPALRADGGGGWAGSLAGPGPAGGRRRPGGQGQGRGKRAARAGRRCQGAELIRGATM
jgi:hypothetical protein